MLEFANGMQTATVGCACFAKTGVSKCYACFRYALLISVRSRARDGPMACFALASLASLAPLSPQTSVPSLAL